MSERNLYEVTGDIKDINTLLVSREEWNRRAQPAQAPMTDSQAKAVIASTAYAFEAMDILRAAERHHGIVGEKGGA